MKNTKDFVVSAIERPLLEIDLLCRCPTYDPVLSVNNDGLAKLTVSSASGRPSYAATSSSQTWFLTADLWSVSLEQLNLQPAFSRFLYDIKSKTG
ncbi:hypothetical protein EVAR_2282_1 [Eumeta japonica]|uniref:Uncharacterized protein n=1 Tax=Eumeta variegata TaxID=151549 RepID=A0A4C1SFU2_EUMVA|nr:hypothetical protein EVAR_2282_1 [Eumeta japonica]